MATSALAMLASTTGPVRPVFADSGAAGPMSPGRENQLLRVQPRTPVSGGTARQVEVDAVPVSAQAVAFRMHGIAAEPVAKREFAPAFVGRSFRFRRVVPSATRPP